MDLDKYTKSDMYSGKHGWLSNALPAFMWMTSKLQLLSHISAYVVLESLKVRFGVLVSPLYHLMTSLWPNRRQTEVRL